MDLGSPEAASASDKRQMVSHQIGGDCTLEAFSKIFKDGK